MRYFVEVKHRQTNQQGYGLDYITTQKLKQMKFAAELWVQQHYWAGEVSLAAIEISGQDYDITNFLIDIN